MEKRLSNRQIPKLGLRTCTCAFIGYPLTTKAYRFLNLENNRWSSSRFEIVEDNFHLNLEISFSVFKFRVVSSSIKTQNDSKLGFGRSIRGRTEKDYGTEFCVNKVERVTQSSKETLSSLDSYFRRETVNDQSMPYFPMELWN